MKGDGLRAECLSLAALLDHTARRRAPRRLAPRPAWRLGAVLAPRLLVLEQEAAAGWRTRKAGRRFFLRSSRQEEAGCRSRLEPRMTRQFGGSNGDPEGHALARDYSRSLSLAVVETGAPELSRTFTPDAAASYLGSKAAAIVVGAGSSSSVDLTGTTARGRNVEQPDGYRRRARSVLPGGRAPSRSPGQPERRGA
jgi:hypothetical protein